MLKEHLIDSLFLVLSSLVVLDIIIFGFLSFKSSSDQESNNSHTLCWQDKLRNWICLIANILGLAVLIWLSLAKKPKFIMSILVLFTFLQQIVNALPSAEDISSIIFGKNENDWSKYNFISLLLISVTFSYLHFSQILSSIGSYILPRLMLETQEWLRIIRFSLLLSLLTFLIISVSIYPLKLLAQKCLNTSFKVGKWLNGQGKELSNIYDIPLCAKPFSAAAISKCHNRHLIVRIFFKITVPFAFILDIILTILQMIFTILVSIFWYLICILIHLNYLFFRISEHMANTSERTVIVVAFRISLILGLCITVIINRYNPFFASPETPCAVIEFIASVILIPVILEWIMSFRK